MKGRPSPPPTIVQLHCKCTKQHHKPKIGLFTIGRRKAIKPTETITIMSEQATSPAPSATETPSASVATPAPVPAKFSLLDSVTGAVDISKVGAKAFVARAVDNAKALGLPLGYVDAGKVSSAIGRLLSDSRESKSTLTGKGGRSTDSATFAWADVAKSGEITTLQATILSAVGAISSATDKVRKARNAAK